MTVYSQDVVYAWLQLGLDRGASNEDVRQAVAAAEAWRFSTRERVAQVRRLGEFFAARARLGAAGDSFAEIRKAYHKQAMALHPDRNRGDRAAEEHLKKINAAYDIVERVHREARDYFKQSAAIRDKIERAARQSRERESPPPPPTAAAPKPARKTARPRPANPAGAGRAVTYVAASVPRYIRTARLFYLPLRCVIGSRLVKPKGSAGLMYDIIMLPEKDFMRARLNLGSEGSSSPGLRMSKLTPAYIPQDRKELAVPSSETDPYQYAKAYFLEAFGL